MNWNEIKEDYESSTLTLKALAEKHNVKLGTLKSRKSREKWTRDPTKKDATKSKKVATAEPTVENSKLNAKQNLFCLYYIKYFNATKAYQEAYKCAYSTAMVEGSRHLKNPKIKAEIDRLKQETYSSVALDGKAVLQKYIDIAFADITDFTSFGRKKVDTGKVDENGEPITVEINYIDFKESTDIDGTIISEVKQGKDGVSIKLADKMKAMDFLSKYVDLLSDNDKKRLQEEKLKADIAKVKGEDGTEYEDDGFIDAIKSSTDIWDDDNG